MQFRIEQRFTSDPATVITAFTDPDLYASYTGLSKIGRPEVLERNAKGSRVELALRMRFIADLPSAAKAVVDPTKLSWVQREQYDLDRLTATVRFEPDNYADRFSCTGGYDFVASVDGSIRQAAGDLKVHMLLVGGQVEKALVSGLREHFAEEQPLVQRFLDQRAG